VIERKIKMTVVERFLKYVAYGTQSNGENETVPSTPGQKVLGEALVEELHQMGLRGNIDDKGYVYGVIPATSGYEEEPVIGLIAHMDTSDAASGDNIKASIVKAYDGGDIVLNREKKIVMSPADYPGLKDSVGNDLIVTDGYSARDG
jgi:tripeptide aminopeptidase